MKAVRKLALAGVLITSLGWAACPASGEEGAVEGEKKRGFKPGRLIGKLIPGGKDDAAPAGEAPPPVADDRIPPPVIPGAAMPPAAEAEKKPARGVLSGVTGAVGKLLPDGSRREARQEEPEARVGLIGRLRQGREAEADLPGPTPTPPPAIAVPVPMQQGRIADDTLSDQPNRPPKKVITIPIAPEAPPHAPEVSARGEAEPTAPPLVTEVESPPPPRPDPPVAMAPIPAPALAPVEPLPAPPAPSPAAPAAAPALAFPAGKEAPRTDEVGGAHFVTIRDGVEAKVKLPDGQEGVLKPGTVMRFDGKDAARVRARLANGAGIELELWQVRDATFEEAVKFIQSSE
jgi:hypothetical protein